MIGTGAAGMGVLYGMFIDESIPYYIGPDGRKIFKETMNVLVDGFYAGIVGVFIGLFVDAIILSDRVYKLNNLGKDERLKKLQEISNSFPKK